MIHQIDTGLERVMEDVAARPEDSDVLLDESARIRSHRLWAVGCCADIATEAELDNLGMAAAEWLVADEVEPHFSLVHREIKMVDMPLTWLHGRQEEEIKDTPVVEGWFVARDPRVYGPEGSARGVDIQPHQFNYYLIAGLGIAGCADFLRGPVLTDEAFPGGLEIFPDLKAWSGTEEDYRTRLDHIRRGIVGLLNKNKAI